LHLVDQTVLQGKEPEEKVARGVNGAHQGGRLP
jgi:hypothetical protein